MSEVEVWVEGAVREYAELVARRKPLEEEVEAIKKRDGVDEEGAMKIIHLVSLNQKIEALGKAIQEKVDEEGVPDAFLVELGKRMRESA